MGLGLFSDHPHEECGVFGIFNRDGYDTSKTVYHALYSLQHRGQESCGIAVGDREAKKTSAYKDLGLVGDVFDDSQLADLKGDMAIGHVRYSTTGGNNRVNAQPLSIRYVKGTLSIAHNGNISNASKLRRELEMNGAVFQSTSDTEVIAFLLAQERLKSKSIEEAVYKIIPRLEGAFSLLVMSPQKLIAVRDPLGIRPLCAGMLGESEVYSSETCALDAIGARSVGDILPGEIRVVDKNGVRRITDYCGRKPAFCIFEHIYFARPDSIIDGQSVYEARLEAGRILAEEEPAEADLVIGVPDSAIIAALGYAEKSGIPYGEGLVKNRYIGRTFIQPDQSTRERSVSIKLNALSSNLSGKRVVMIDDSIVRGTTMRHLVELLRKAGAIEVHVRVSSPPFLWPCYFGTDVPDRDQLACNQYTIDELRERIGADSLGFLPLRRVTEIAKQSTSGFCDACFSGSYPYEVPESVDKMLFGVS